MAKVRICPNCGEEAVYTLYNKMRLGTAWYVHCEICGLSIVPEKTKERAEATWDRLFVEPQQRIAELEAEVKRLRSCTNILPGEGMVIKDDDDSFAVCPKCLALLPDPDGFGFTYCPKCGYCTHPNVNGGVCSICGRKVEE